MFKKKANKNIIALIIILLVIISFLVFLLVFKDTDTKDKTKTTKKEEIEKQAKQEINLQLEEPKDIPLPKELILEPDYMGLDEVKINRNQQSDTIPTKETLEEQIKRIRKKLD